MKTLFDTSLPERTWTTLSVAGFNAPIPGALFRASNKPCCGVPLGGIGTGCVDIDAAGNIAEVLHPDYRQELGMDIYLKILENWALKYGKPEYAL